MTHEEQRVAQVQAEAMVVLQGERETRAIERAADAIVRACDAFVEATKIGGAFGPTRTRPLR